MTVDEFLKEQAEALAQKEQASKKMERLLVEAKKKELGCERLAKCPYCNKIVASSDNLPFLEKKPNMDYDTYYCGCFGLE